MTKHTKIYTKALGYEIGDYIGSEIDGTRAVDTHHIIGRGKGGEDRIENLMAVTREQHIEFGDKKEHMIYLLTTHMNFLAVNGVPFSNDWFDEKIKYYKSITE